MMDREINHNSDAEWDLWYQDTFDRECPRQIEISGMGLQKGLLELWVRHLYETVQPNGGRGFSRFNLWWRQSKKSIVIDGDWDGLVRLRKWVYGETHKARNMQDGDMKLLKKVVEVHENLIINGKTSEDILLLAKTAENRIVFENQIIN